MTFRVDKTVLDRAREKAGGGDKLAEVMRRMTAAYALGKWKPDGTEDLRLRLQEILRSALEELE